jgi:hypothetical protein
MMLANSLAAVVGFGLAVVAALFAMGAIWPTMSYETVLPVLLVCGIAGAALTLIFRRRRAQLRQKGAP